MHDRQHVGRLGVVQVEQVGVRVGCRDAIHPRGGTAASVGRQRRGVQHRAVQATQSENVRQRGVDTVEGAVERRHAGQVRQEDHVTVDESVRR